jgi:hypothetical protein
MVCILSVERRENMRRSLIALLAVVLFAVGVRFRPGSPDESASAPEEGDGQPQPVIVVGQPYNEALGILENSKARRCDENVGFGIGNLPGDNSENDYSFWVLPDATGLWLIGSGATKEDLFVSAIEVGPRGIGFGDKLRWIDEGQCVDRLLLSDYRQFTR